MEKRGVSHIEVILSFVLFIGAISLILYFFNPLNLTRNEDSSLLAVSQSIVKNSSIDVMQYSVSLNGTALGQIAGIEITGIPANYKVAAVSYSGEILNVSRNGNVVSVEWKNQPFFYLKFSEDFEESLVIPAVPISGSYRLGSADNGQVISMKRIALLNGSYYSNYEGTKTALKIPPKTEFGFGVSLENSQVILAAGSTARGINVYSSSDRKEFVGERGDLRFGNLDVFVW